MCVPCVEEWKAQLGRGAVLDDGVNVNNTDEDDNHKLVE